MLQDEGDESEAGQSKPKFGEDDVTRVPTVYYFFQLAERDGEKIKMMEDKLKLYVLRIKERGSRRRQHTSVAAAGGGSPILTPTQNSMQLVALP